MSPSNCTGLILAGGHSHRFGEDKARYEVGGQAMIARVVDTVAAVAHPVLVSVGEHSNSFAGLRNVGYVVDHYKDAGPLAGLHAGLHKAQTPWLLAIACDMPFLAVEVLRTLLAARTPTADAIVARTPDGRLHPLCACYHTRTLSVVREQMEGGNRALHALLNGLPQVLFVDLPATPLRNVNRPADLHAETRNWELENG
ncbi:MAG TPA: molybdenum cofactor guanylyltransferase [Rhodothermales bacterium]|nr:molybdenum cofactor guanylyltransferase [Rhodothermales bacterium]